MPNIQKNLVFGYLLSQKGFKLVFVFDKFVPTKNGMHVGKGYMSDVLFKMNVLTIVSSNINKNTFAYMI